MKKLLTFLSTGLAMLAIGFVVGALSPSRASADAVTLAHDGEDHSEEVAQTNDNSGDETDEEKYSYVAQAGDSYSQIARKAVQTYGVDNDINIGAAGVIFAETNLTQVANWPELEIGQEVNLTKASVKEWVEKAQKLTDAEKAEWNYYVPFVDFNTNRVGQA